MTDKWIKDTGLVLALLFLILGFSGSRKFLVISILFIVLSTLIPKTLYPVAYVWLKLVKVLNMIVPKIFFSLVFFVVVLPIGFLHRLVNNDTMLISSWEGSVTAFIDRNYKFLKQDLEVPY
ncbi:MAG: hypothetical protein AAB484_02715 [Patescibacteria group bacterium]